MLIMNKCKNTCLNEQFCSLIGCCIYEHELVNDRNISLFTKYEKLTLRDCVNSFQIIKPPKVSGRQIRANFRLRNLLNLQKKGIEVVGLQGFIANTKKTFYFEDKKGLKKINLKSEKPKKKPIPPEFIIFSKYKRKCIYVGTINKVIGHKVSIGTMVFYEEVEDLYVLQTGLSFHRKTIEDYIDFINKPSDKPILDILEKIKTEPYINFHDEDTDE